jgi:hypothetical protein
MVTLGENWKCPYCGHAQVLDGTRVSQSWHLQDVEGWTEGVPIVHLQAIVCANNDCKALTLGTSLGHFLKRGLAEDVVGPIKDWTLLPPSTAKPQPDYIPQPIRDDYYEACAIRDLSPKASATITRRCLQGMIRNFCRISKKRLVDEIDELGDRVHNGTAPAGVLPDTVVAIDQVRKIGNIGAHMEADIDVIIDVDPDEAQILIDLVELLFAEWYVARDARTHRLANLKKIADDKEKQKQQKPGEPAR